MKHISFRNHQWLRRVLGDQLFIRLFMLIGNIEHKANMRGLAKLKLRQITAEQADAN